MKTLVDLSMPINEQTIVFPGDALPAFEQAGTLESDKFVDHIIHINNHLGTHIDAPGHMVAGGKGLADYEIDAFVKEAICLDARGETVLTTSILVGIDLKNVGAVLIYTGRGDSFREQSYADEYPEFSSELAQALVGEGISMVGVDMISYDHEAPFPIHNIFLEQDILLIENLVNLGEVVGRRFRITALPINLELEAAPARVVAEL